MSVSSSTSRVQYTLSTTTQTLAVPFYFLASSHLKVLKSVVGSAPTVLTLGTHYTVAGAGVEAGGSITLTGTGVAVADKITIKRSVPKTQGIDYITNDRFPAKTHEEGLDKLTMQVQELGEQADRGLRLPEDEAGGEHMTLPAAADRAGKGLEFDEDGNLVVTEAASASAAAALASKNAAAASEVASASSAAAAASYQPKIEVATVAALKALATASFSNGDVAKARGYGATNDGGDGDYVWTPTSAAADNAGTVIAPNAGTGRWLRLCGLAVSVRWFGARGDGVTDDSAAIAAALVVAQAVGGSVHVPSGTYLVTRQGTFPVVGYPAGTIPYVFRITAPVRIYGDGTAQTKFLVPMHTGSNANLFLFTATQGCSVENIGADRSVASNGTGIYGGALVSADQCKRIIVQNCYTKDLRGLVNFFACEDSRAVGCLAERVNIAFYSGSHFGSYASNNCAFIDCEGYGGTNDGDMAHYASGRSNSLIRCKLFNYLRADVTKAIVATVNQGFCVDASQTMTLVTGCVAYGYYYGIDVKSNCDHVTISDCFAQRNKIGIAVRRGELNSPTLNTVIRGCTVLPDGGNGNTTVVIDGFQVVGIWLQDAFGTLIEGNTIGKSYLDSVTPDNFLCIGETRPTTGDASTMGWTKIVNNKFISQANFAGKNRTNPRKFIFMAGASGSIRNVIIAGNEFRSVLAGDVTYDFLTLSEITGITISGNTFGSFLHGTSGSTGGAIRMTNVSGAIVSGNFWASHGQILNAAGCSKLTFSNNVLRECVSGVSGVQIYLDNVRGFSMTGNNYDYSGGAFNDGRPLESVNTPATGRYLIAGNLLSITNYGSTNWYRIDGVDAPYRADVLVRDNVISGLRLTGALSATATLNFASIAAGASEDLTITLTGAVVGDSVDLGLPAAPTAGIVFIAFVSAADTVTVRATNITGGAVDPASATYRVTLSNR
jgi:hypothetical protein